MLVHAVPRTPGAHRQLPEFSCCPNEAKPLLRWAEPESPLGEAETIEDQLIDCTVLDGLELYRDLFDDRRCFDETAHRGQRAQGISDPGQPPLHHVNDVRGWLEAHKHEIEVLYLLAYSPKLNLDEYLNSDLKAGVLSRPARASMSG